MPEPGHGVSSRRSAPLLSRGGWWSWGESNPRPSAGGRTRYDHSRPWGCRSPTGGSADHLTLRSVVRARSFPGVSRLSGRQWSFSPSSPASVAGLRWNWPRATFLLTMSLRSPEDQAARANCSSAILVGAPFSESEQLGSHARPASLTSKPVSPVGRSHQVSATRPQPRSRTGAGGRPRQRERDGSDLADPALGVAEATFELLGGGLGDPVDAGPAVELGVDLGVRPPGEVDELLGQLGVGSRSRRLCSTRDTVGSRRWLERPAGAGRPARARTRDRASSSSSAPSGVGVPRRLRLVVVGGDGRDHREQARRRGRGRAARRVVQPLLPRTRRRRWSRRRLWRRSSAIWNARARRRGSSGMYRNACWRRTPRRQRTNRPTAWRKNSSVVVVVA